MKRLQTLIWLDYKEYKKSLLVIYITVSLLMILFCFGTAYDTRSLLYTYNESTHSYILTEPVAIRPEECLSSICNPLLLQLFLLMSGFLSFFFTARNYQDKSIYVMRRLPLNPRIYLLSKYLPAFLLLLIGYLLCMIQTLVFFGIYQLMIPNQCIPSDCWNTYIHSTQLTRLYPFLKLKAFLPILLIGLFVPAIGLFVYEIPRAIQKSIHWIRTKWSALKGGK